MPSIPKQIYYLAGQYTWNTGSGNVVARIDASCSEDINTCFDSASCAWRNGNGKGKGKGKGLEVDTSSLWARLTWFSPAGDWRMTARGDNLTDYNYQAGGNALISTMETMSDEWNIPRTCGWSWLIPVDVDSPTNRH